MIGWGITLVIWFILFGWWFHQHEKRLSIRTLILGKPPGRSLLVEHWERWFPKNPVRSQKLIFASFLLPWGIGSWAWWMNGTMLYIFPAGVASISFPVLADRSFRWWWKRRCFQQWKDALRVFSTILRIGRPWVEAVHRAANETSEPLRSVLYQMEGEIRFGSTEGEALRRMADRTGIDALYALTHLVEMVSEKGGNVAEALDDLAAQWEEEEELLADLRTETGMYRLSAYLLPLIMLGLVVWFWPTISPLMKEAWFLTLFIGASLSVLTGLVVSMRIVSKLDI